jgi:hypothetical protein
MDKEHICMDCGSPVCVICGEAYKGHGCNAIPVADGRCCDKCDALIVLPARMSRLSGKPPESFKEWAKDMYALTKFYKQINTPHKDGNGQ